MALSIIYIKAHGNSLTERATILATLRGLPNQAFPLSLFPCEESRLERLRTTRVSGPGPLYVTYGALGRTAARARPGSAFGLAIVRKLMVRIFIVRSKHA